jgi:hypothetical protein
MLARTPSVLAGAMDVAALELAAGVDVVLVLHAPVGS